MKNLERNPAEIRAQFSQNLKGLIDPARPKAQIARELGINRTQLGRFLSGEAHPRPDLLAQICQYFNTDARILTEPLEQINSATVQSASETLPFTFQSATQLSFPNGFYEEWMPDWALPDIFSLHIIHARTIEGRRQIRIRIPQDWYIDHTTPRHRHPYVTFTGYVIEQSSGIAIIDTAKPSQTIAFAVLQRGFLEDPHLYSGYKLSGIGPRTGFLRTRAPVALRYLGPRPKDVLPSARLPFSFSKENIPPKIRIALRDADRV